MALVVRGAEVAGRVGPVHVHHERRLDRVLQLRRGRLVVVRIRGDLGVEGELVTVLPVGEHRDEHLQSRPVCHRAKVADHGPAVLGDRGLRVPIYSAQFRKRGELGMLVDGERHRDVRDLVVARCRGDVVDVRPHLSRDRVPVPGELRSVLHPRRLDLVADILCSDSGSSSIRRQRNSKHCCKHRPSALPERRRWRTAGGYAQAPSRSDRWSLL